MKTLAVRRSGQGPPVLLLHGGLVDGRQAWTAQEALAAHHTLVVPDRVGYGASAQLGDAEDFERDARLLAEIIDPSSHVVGHSSGALAALLLASLRPENVATLTLIEPPAFHVAPEAAALQRLHEEHWDRTDQEPVPWLRGFFEINSLDPPPDKVLAALAGPAGVWRRFVRRPWHGELPLDDVAQHSFPKLVVSGGHNPAFEAVCDVVAAGLRADRAVIPGEGHAVQRTGAPFNQLLTSLWSSPRR